MTRTIIAAPAFRIRSALRETSPQKCYGGDVIRKLLEKQDGRKRMRQFGKVDIPQEAFIHALKMGV